MPDTSEPKTDAARERRDAIIDAALTVFAEKGFDSATTKDIAAAAGIQHTGLLYHYFRKKADVMVAVVEKFAPPLALIARADETREMEPREALTRIGQAYLHIRDYPAFAPFLRVILREALLHPRFANIFAQSGPFKVLRFLSDYLQLQMDRGKMRRTDPWLAAISFLGPLVANLMLTVALRLPAPEYNAETIVAHQVELFLRGMKPEDTPT